MSSIAGICNRALSSIGAQTTLQSLEETSPEAQQCALWYDNQRQSLLRAAPWAFCRTQLPLTQVGQLFSNGSTEPGNTSPYPYLFKYAYPASCLKFRYILPNPCLPAQDQSIAPTVGFGPIANFRPSRAFRFMVHTEVDDIGVMRKYLLSNVPNAIGVFSLDVTDPTMFDSMFDSALSSSLAYHLAIALTGNVGIAEQRAKAADASILNARAVDASEAIPTTDHVVDWIEGRNPYQGPGLVGPGWGSWYCTWEDMTWGM